MSLVCNTKVGRGNWIDLHHSIAALLKFDQTQNKTHHWKEQAKISKWTNCQSYSKVSRSAVILKIVVFRRFCKAKGHALLVQFILPYRTLQKLQFSNWWRFAILWSQLRKLVHVLILVCSFQWCVLFLCLAKFYRSCSVRHEGLLQVLFWVLAVLWRFERCCFVCPFQLHLIKFSVVHVRRHRPMPAVLQWPVETFIMDTPIKFGQAQKQITALETAANQNCI